LQPEVTVRKKNGETKNLFSSKNSNESLRADFFLWETVEYDTDQSGALQSAAAVTLLCRY